MNQEQLHVDNEIALVKMSHMFGVDFSDMNHLHDYLRAKEDLRKTPNEELIGKLGIKKVVFKDAQNKPVEFLSQYRYVFSTLVSVAFQKITYSQYEYLVNTFSSLSAEDPSVKTVILGGSTQAKSGVAQVVYDRRKATETKQVQDWRQYADALVVGGASGLESFITLCKQRGIKDYMYSCSTLLFNGEFPCFRISKDGTNLNIKLAKSRGRNPYSGIIQYLIENEVLPKEDAVLAEDIVTDAAEWEGKPLPTLGADQSGIIRLFKDGTAASLGATPQPSSKTRVSQAPSTATAQEDVVQQWPAHGRATGLPELPPIDDESDDVFVPQPAVVSRTGKRQPAVTSAQIQSRGGVGEITFDNSQSIQQEEREYTHRALPEVIDDVRSWLQETRAAFLGEVIDTVNKPFFSFLTAEILLNQHFQVENLAQYEEVYARWFLLGLLVPSSILLNIVDTNLEMPSPVLKRRLKRLAFFLLEVVPPVVLFNYATDFLQENINAENIHTYWYALYFSLVYTGKFAFNKLRTKNIFSGRK